MKELKKQLKKSKKVKESKGNIQSKPIISKPNAAETRNVKSLIDQTRQLLSVLNPSEDVDSIQKTTEARSKLLVSRRDFETEGAAARPGSSSSGSCSDSISILGDEIESLASSPDTSFIAKEKPGPLHSGNLYLKKFYLINHWIVFFFYLDKIIGAALEKMLAMGFKDEGGWLTRLLEVKGGDIVKVLNVLHLS